MGYLENISFEKHFNLTQEDLNYLWQLFNDFGLTKGKGENRSSGNHYFLQGICQYHCVEWDSWKDKLTENVKAIIEEKYPQLKVQNKKFEKQ